jgi:hypothetical protein
MRDRVLARDEQHTRGEDVANFDWRTQEVARSEAKKESLA